MDDKGANNNTDENLLHDLKGKAVRGSFIGICTQGIKFFLRTGSLILMARLLIPEEFGLVGMVTAVTGVIGLFKDAGLSMVTIQRPNITEEQVSTLFWINMAVGVVLCVIMIAIAPYLASFYREPRLLLVTVVLGSGFIFNAAATQHQALLQRRMRYTSLAVADLFSLLISVTCGIIMALWGFGYWALVAMAVVLPATNAILVWLAAAWIPGTPRRNIEIRSMLHFGGTVTLNSLVTYLTYNADKILLGRFWGASGLGIYGRAYQLVNLPMDNLNGAIGWVAFPVLSRIQNDPIRVRNFFLKGYSMVLALTIPIVVGFALFADEIIFVLLGSKWKDAAVIFRILAPTGFAFALINPFGWLLMSRGQVGRSLKMALAIAPVVIAGYIAGLRYGPNGVAFGFSAGMTLLIVPMIAWAKHGTAISSRDILRAVARPIVSGIVAGIITLCIQFYIGRLLPPYQALLLGGSCLMISYTCMLFYAMGQKELYFEVIAELRKRA